MLLGILKEPADKRVVLPPGLLPALPSATVLVEENAGLQASFSDAEYQEKGAQITSRQEILTKASCLVSIHPLPEAELAQLAAGTAVISLYKPFARPETLDQLKHYPCHFFSLDMMPRITIAQDKDVLSSMASVAGYRAVLEAAMLLPRYMPMLTTAAGSIPPAKVLILGAGVAGLQAIATARRLGAVVEAFDTRLAAREEVQSLGARFVEVEGARDDKAAGGYAVEQTEEYKERQRALIAEKVEKSDIVITTAQLRGKPAPQLISREMVERMKPGSVIIDLAASTGGNCALSENQQLTEHQGVYILGNSELEARMPQHASQLFGKNVANYLKVLYDKEGQLQLDMENPLIKGPLIVSEGKVLYAAPVPKPATT